MPTHHGTFNPDGIVQPGGTIAIEREGKWTASHTYICRRDDINNALSNIGGVGAEHPDFGFMTCESVQVEYLDADLAQISVSYAGTEETDDSNATYSLNVTLSEEPLLSHPVYSTLDPAEQDALRAIAAGKGDDSGMPYVGAITSQPAAAILFRLQRGQQAYLKPRLNWRQSYVSTTELTNADTDQIGKISIPPGPVPSLAGSANWLLNSVTANLEGSAWTIEKEWISSDDEGWDAALYS